MDTKNGTGGIARNISATLQSLQTENEQLRAGYDAARQEIASLKAQPYDQQAMGLCHVCGWKGVIDYPDGPVCVACEHDKTLSPQPTAQAQHVHWVTPTIAQMKEYCKQASAMMARDLTRFDAACEVMGYLKEMRAPGYYMHRMNIVLHGNVEGTDAARASDKAPQPTAQAQEDASGWMRDGALLYRLTGERRPANFDEIRVTMANGSRDIGQMSAQAERLLVMLTAPQPAAPTQAGEYPPSSADMVMAALDTEEWGLERMQRWDCITDEGNREGAWLVKRQKAPYCADKPGEPYGPRSWSGPTALDALQKAADDLGIRLPQPAAPAQAAPVDAESWLDLLAEARAALWQPANAALCERLDAFIDAARAAQKGNHD